MNENEVCVTYIHRVFCIVNEETGEVDRVLGGHELELDTAGPDGYIHDLAEASIPPLSADTERGRKAVEIAETHEWPAWDYS